MYILLATLVCAGAIWLRSRRPMEGPVAAV